MPRGRHRHSPPLHRLLPPSAIAGVAVVCALAPWVFSSLGVVRALAGVAALTAIGGAVVMRQWDAQAGKQVAELTRARVSDEWRYDERVAELETDLEESRELRAKLERRLRAKRAELAGLRGEHASLLRRYATAETERASALEGRRLLEIEAVPESGTLALPAGPSAAAEDTAEAPEAPAAVSAKELYLKAAAALARLERSAESVESVAEPEPEAAADAEAESEVAAVAKGEPDSAATEAGADGTGEHAAERAEAPAEGLGPVDAEDEVTEAHTTPEEAPEEAQAHTAGSDVVPARSTGQRPAGHFTVPTAVAVVPAAPSRRPLVEGGFDFFGTQKDTSAELDVRNEDLADVVGQEALALHKADAGSAYKPAGTYDVGQVIDLTAHDETEHIDVEGLRSAAS
ncbi:hypothetical protein ACFV3N_22415 [Streptomyces bauhiniae]|uniref:hypothetical protein n=1 Tax=Streptomyces bauhiniae TaxID=2340725 RepID=UPI00364FA27F